MAAERPPTERDIVDRHLRRAWHAVAPAPGLEAQVRARLTSSAAATLGAMALGMGANARPVSAWASLRASGKLGALVGTGLLGLGLLSGYFIRDNQLDVRSQAAPVAPIAEVNLAAPPHAGLPASDPVAAIPSSSRVPDASRGERAPAPPSARAPRTVRAPAGKMALVPRDGASFNVAAAPANDELALLRRADRAVRADNAALALALVGELDARYPGSSLLEERRAIELLAYCGVGATDASARAQRFLGAHPTSVYAGRIQRTCPGKGELSTPALDKGLVRQTQRVSKESP
jgi:hypothetical protein